MYVEENGEESPLMIGRTYEMQADPIHIGCAGWSILREQACLFPASGTILERYAAVFSAVEINSSFYRPHRPTTYARWARSAPEGFRFSVKTPRLITHEKRLANVEEPLERFLAETAQLDGKLGPLLVQLPPSLRFAPDRIEKFLAMLRDRYPADVALEPRHKTWFDPAVEQLLVRCRVARVATDPCIVPAAAAPGGWQELVYYRLHGSPKMYYSAYDEAYLESLARTLEQSARSARVWCIFDNTAEGAAIANASDVLRRLQSL